LADTFPLADRPRLRPVEVIPVQSSGNGRGVWLRDPADPDIQPLSVSAAGVEVLMLLDGRRTIGDIAAGMALRGVSIGEPQVRTFLSRLDEGGFLEGPRFEHRLQARKAAFLAEPVRAAIHAGGAYPSGVAELPRMLAAAYTDRDGPGVPPPAPATDASAPALRALIAPHVDLHRGAPTYSWAYRAVAESQPAELYVILGTCHTPVQGHFAATRKAYDTPLGPMPADGPFLDRLGQLYQHDLYEGELSHAGEHSIEFQAVYLRWLGVTAPIVPLLCDSLHSMVPAGKSPRSVPLVREFIDSLREAMAQDGRRITLIAAVDLAHIGQRFGDRWLVDPAHQASVERGDREMLDFVFEPNPEAYYAQVMQDRDARRICGLTPIYILTALMESEQRRGALLHYTQWVDTDLSSSVTFASAIFR
jgi:AmmeMemoRadiSam system protein B